MMMLRFPPQLFVFPVFWHLVCSFKIPISIEFLVPDNYRELLSMKPPLLASFPSDERCLYKAGEAVKIEVINNKGDMKILNINYIFSSKLIWHTLFPSLLFLLTLSILREHCIAHANLSNLIFIISSRPD